MSQPMTILRSLNVRLERLAQCIPIALLSVVTVFGADTTKKSFDLPADTLETSMKRFSVQSGLEVLIPGDAVADVRTRRVRGEMSSRDALEAMLAGTGLTSLQDPKTGALTVKREAARPLSGSGEIRLERFEVNESRVSGLVNQGVIPREENEAIYFEVMNRAEIEQMGATDINEVFRYVPQLADFAMDSQAGLASGFNSFGGNTNRTQLDLRGFGSASTTVLVNGRRMPVVRETQGGGPDIGRIPISAIERIEFMPGAAGGIYGTNTMGGVINVILRRDYQGRELSVNVGSPLRGKGAREYKFSYTEGRTFLDGRANLTLTFSAEKRTQMNYEERPLYRNFLTRFPLPPTGDLALFISKAGFSNFLPQPGVIVGRNAANQIAPLNIPGGPANATFAVIPLGQDGTGLTPASFAATANQLRYGEPIGKFPMVNPQNNVSLNANYTHELIKDRLTLYGELGLGFNYVQNTLPAPPQTLNLTATDPRNPFRTGVTPGYVGQPITLYYIMSDVRGTKKTSERDTVRGVIGVSGKVDVVGRPWTWAVDGSVDYNRRYSFAFTPAQTISLLNSRGGVNETARNYYSLFADHIQFPNANAAAFLPESSFRKNSDYIALGTVNTRLNGEVFSLPAGVVRASLYGEGKFVDYYNDFRLRYDEAFSAAIGLGPQSSYSPGATSRTAWAYGAELQVPVLGPKWRLGGIHSASVSLAYSAEDPNDANSFGSLTAGGAISPVKGLTFRSSVSEGTQTPNDQFTQAAVVETENVTSTVPDPLRGRQPIGTYDAITGGNPDLNPERTKTMNFGVVYEPAYVKGLRLNADYGYTRKSDAVQTLTVTDLIQYEGQYPGRVVRAAPTAGDLALGYAGQVLSLDTRRTNIGNIWSQYLDLKVRYLLETRNAGTFTFTTSSTSNLDYKFKLRPGVATENRLDRLGFPLKFRGMAMVAWRKSAWNVSTLANYVDDFRDIDDTPVGSSVTYNLQVSYEVPYGALSDRPFRRWMAGTKWTMGCNDIFDYDPPFVGSAPGFISRFVDPRGRYLYVNVKKSL